MLAPEVIDLAACETVLKRYEDVLPEDVAVTILNWVDDVMHMRASVRGDDLRRVDSARDLPKQTLRTFMDRDDTGQYLLRACVMMTEWPVETLDFPRLAGVLLNSRKITVAHLGTMFRRFDARGMGDQFVAACCQWVLVFPLRLKLHSVEELRQRLGDGVFSNPIRLRSLEPQLAESFPDHVGFPLDMQLRIGLKLRGQVPFPDEWFTDLF